MKMVEELLKTGAEKGKRRVKKQGGNKRKFTSSTYQVNLSKVRRREIGRRPTPLLFLARVFARYLHSDESVCPPRVFRVSTVAMSGLVLAFVWIVNWAAGESMLFAWVEEKILARVESLAELTNSKCKSSSSDLTYLLFFSIQSLLSLHPIHNLYLILDRGAGKVGDL